MNYISIRNLLKTTRTPANANTEEWRCALLLCALPFLTFSGFLLHREQNPNSPPWRPRRVPTHTPASLVSHPVPCPPRCGHTGLFSVPWTDRAHAGLRPVLFPVSEHCSPQRASLTTLPELPEPPSLPGPLLYVLSFTALNAAWHHLHLLIAYCLSLPLDSELHEGRICLYFVHFCLLKT